MPENFGHFGEVLNNLNTKKYFPEIIHNSIMHFSKGGGDPVGDY